VFLRPFVYTGVPITHESLCRVDQPSLLRNINEANKAPLLSEREMAHVETLLRWPDPIGPLRSHTALKDAFDMERLYHGGLSIDYPVEGGDILLMSRASRQGPPSKIQEDPHPPRFGFMDLDVRSEGLCELMFHI